MLLIGPWYAQHTSLASGAAQCDIVIAIYRISLSFAGNELGNDPTARKQLRWRRRLDLICSSGQHRTNSLVARTYARWPLWASGVLDPLARRVKKSAGPAVNVEACTKSHRSLLSGVYARGSKSSHQSELEMCNLSWTPYSSLEKDNSQNHSYVSPKMGCLEYT